MARRYYSSIAARTTLAAPVNDTAVTLSVVAVSGWPASYPYTLIVDQDTVNEEVVSVTGRTGTTLTVTRGVDGTTAVAHDAGAVVQHGVSAQDFDEPNDFINGTGVVTETLLEDGAVTEAKLGTGAVTSAKILDGTIVNADVNASAAIAQSKIADLTSDLASKVTYSYGTATPSSPSEGDIWFDENTTPPTAKFYDGSSFQTFSAGAADFSNAASGTYTDTGVDYKYLTFTASGTLTVTRAGFADVLLIGGGGGGGKFGGGGGGGSHFYATDVYLPSGSVTVTVGAGGAGATSATQLPTPGKNGQISRISDYIGPGGGGGGGQSRDASGIRQAIYGIDGASGGGGNTAGGGSISGLGNNGGTGPTSSVPGSSGGGGGGGSVGGNGSSGNGGAGGAGASSSITGSAVTRCGGGGGGGSSSGGSGGTGGGGDGATSTGGSAGTANTGGGGGGAFSDTKNGLNGGSGVVIVRVRTN